MPRTRSSRKRQQRLAFTPLPSSSPAAKVLHKDVQHRAAAVTLEGSPSPAKRRKLRNDGGESAIPTPVASLELVPDNSRARDRDSASDSEPVRATQRRSDNGSAFTRTRQKRLNFDNARDPSSFDSPIRLSSSASTRSSTKASMFSSQARKRAGKLPSDDSGSDFDGDASATPRPTVTKKSKSRRRKAQEQAESEHAEEVVVESRGQEAQAETEDEDDDMPTTQGTQRRKRRAARRNSFVSVSPPLVSDSDDDVVIMSTRKRARKNREDSEDDDEDDEPVTPARRAPKRARKLTAQEQADLDDDLGFLKPSDDESSARAPRNTQSTKKTARMTALEKLKRKRAGQPEEPEDNNQETVVDLLSDSEKYDSEEDNGLLDENEAEEALPFTSSRQYFQKTNEDADFVEEGDEDDTLGVPAGIPLEFTRYASMKTKELFKFAVEWMVQRKINPAFGMHDPIYDLTFKKLDDEVTGLAGSKFTSSVWTPAFTIALQSRPEILFHRLDQSGDEWMRDKCDACNRTNHPCKYEVQFKGKPYDRHTLENIDHDDDDDNSDASSSSSSSNHSASNREDYNAKGQTVVAASHVFYVGKFCMSNAETAHKLNHWRYHLNEWVENFLQREKYLTADAIVRRDGLSTKKRSKEANKIVDRMERDGRVKELWMEYKDAMDVARQSKQGRYGGNSP